MANIQRISSFQDLLPCFLPGALKQHYAAFLNSRLGKIYKAMPWRELVQVFKIRDNTKGPTSIFSPQGKIALMVLKSYAATSDRKLIEQINANTHYQLFCGIRLQPDQQLKNYKIVSQIRCELSEMLHIHQAQSMLAKYWRPPMDTLSKVLIDATCYESALRYPTVPKLLWESICFLPKMTKKICRALNI